MITHRNIIFTFSLWIFNFTNLWGYTYFQSITPIKVSNDAFIRYIRPQVKSIVNDYYNLLGGINPSAYHIVSIKKNIASVREQWIKIKREKMNHLSMEEIGKFYNRFRSLEIRLMALNRFLFSPQDNTKGKKIDWENRPTLIASTNKISNINYSILHLIEEAQITIDTEIPIDLVFFQTIDRALNEMLLESELAINLLFPVNIRKNLDSVWSLFIEKIEKNISYKSYKDGKRYLLARLSELNMGWNGFHMQVVKGHLDISRENEKKVIQMHRRWNSILKIIL